ncbi:MAG: hypothetical protein AB1351_02655, partial [Thermoproteota archaeon]
MTSKAKMGLLEPDTPLLLTVERGEWKPLWRSEAPVAEAGKLCSDVYIIQITGETVATLPRKLSESTMVVHLTIRR